jgi:hypothetical protein
VAEPTTVAEYLAALPEDRRTALRKVRTVIRANLPKGLVEAFRWGMISYEIPLKVVPDTYNGQPLMVAALGSQKRHMALYLSAVYADEGLRSWFVEAYRASGRRLDMGKSCVRFRSLDDLPLDLVGEAIGAVTVEQFVEAYQRSRR